MKKKKKKRRRRLYEIHMLKKSRFHLYFIKRMSVSFTFKRKA